MMPFTDHSDLFGSVHEAGINLVVRHVMRQRPSLFNYATPAFHQRPDLFCQEIDVADSVLEAGNPLFTEMEPLPVFGTPIEVGLNFCIQLTDWEIDFHPGNIFDLPPELGPLKEQSLALHLRACAGLDCPPSDVLEELVPFFEQLNLEQQSLVVGEVEEGKEGKTARAGFLPAEFDVVAPAPAYGLAGFSPAARRSTTALAPRLVPAISGGAIFVPRSEVIVLPTRELVCFCLEVYGVGHFEWGTVTGSEQQWLKPRVDGLEIVDLQPTPMENALECYAMTIFKLGILPSMIIPMEKMILDITQMLQDNDLNIDQEVSLEPAAVPGDVPNNPAIEEDQLKGFINLVVVEGGP
jgi:hypothetical protein